MHSVSATPYGGRSPLDPIDVLRSVSASRAALVRVYEGRSRRVAAAGLCAAAQHALLLIWVAGFGSFTPPAPPVRLLVSLDLSSVGSHVGTGGGAPSVGSATATTPATPAASLAAPEPAAPAPEPPRETAQPEPVAKAAPPVVPKPKPAVTTSKKVVKPSQPLPAPSPPSSAKTTENAAGKPSASETGTSAGGANPGGTGAGSSGAVAVEASYRARLIAWLASRKRYPARARAMGLEAEVVARITITRDGHVRSRVVEGSSAYALFAREVEAMVDKASPFPQVPSSIAGELFEFRVPVDFRLDETSRSSVRVQPGAATQSGAGILR